MPDVMIRSSHVRPLIELVGLFVPCLCQGSVNLCRGKEPLSDRIAKDSLHLESDMGFSEKLLFSCQVQVLTFRTPTVGWPLRF